MANDPGSTLKTAKFFPTRSTNRTVKESLSATDPADLWRLKLRSSNFSLSLKGLAKKANADVYLLNAKGQILTSSEQSGNRNESLKNLLLATGTYYVAVSLKQGSAATTYRLTMAAPFPTDYLENSFAKAPPIRVNSSGLTFSEFVGGGDPIDFVRFRLPAPGTLNLKLKDLTGNVNLELYNSNRQLIARSANPGTQPEQFSRRLIDYNSTYYIRMAAAPNQNGIYTFNYTFAPDKPVKTASGLQYVDLKLGTGALPQKGQTISVDYTGTFLNGTKFDSSRDRNQPFSFKLGSPSIIAGWNEGLSTMRVGGRRQLIIPARLAYGAQGVPGSIPPNATLVFDVELKSIS